jgi:hypothetical protein
VRPDEVVVAAKQIEPITSLRRTVTMRSLRSFLITWPNTHATPNVRLIAGA